MDIFDLKSGSLYAVLALASSVYLLWGFKFQLRSLLKAVLALQVLGDLLFFNLVVDVGTYHFVGTLTAQDRFYPLLELVTCALAMDAGAWLFGPRWRKLRRTRPPVQLVGKGQTGAKRQNAIPLKLDEGLARRVGLTLALLAVISKVLEMLFSGILTGPSVILGILNWQPEMSSGFTFLETIAVTFAPVGAALMVMHAKKKPHGIALVLLMGFGLLSPWKGSMVTLAVEYAFMVYQFGADELRRLIFNGTTAAIALGVLLYLPVKGEFRSGAVQAEMNVDALTDSFVGTTSAYAMGGVFETYVYVMNSLERGYPTMGGRYDAQALYLWVPRLLWPNKPDIATEDIYYYLELSKDKDEPYGTAFAITVFGTFILDFGFWGGIISSLLFGGLLTLGERGLAKLRKVRSEVIRVYGVTLSVVWLCSFPSLSLGGVPPTFTGMLLAAFMLGVICFPMMMLNQKTKGTGVASGKGVRLPGMAGYRNFRPG